MATRKHEYGCTRGPTHKGACTTVPMLVELPPREHLRRSDDKLSAHAIAQNIGLGFGVIVCIGAALALKLTSKDSTTVDVIFAVFMLLAVALSLPMQFKGFINTVGPYIPILGRGSAARAAITATEDAAVASEKAVTAVKKAVRDAPKGDPG